MCASKIGATVNFGEAVMYLKSEGCDNKTSTIEYSHTLVSCQPGRETILQYLNFNQWQFLEEIKLRSSHTRHPFPFSRPIEWTDQWWHIAFGPFIHAKFLWTLLLPWHDNRRGVRCQGSGHGSTMENVNNVIWLYYIIRFRLISQKPLHRFPEFIFLYLLLRVSSTYVGL